MNINKIIFALTAAGALMIVLLIPAEAKRNYYIEAEKYYKARQFSKASKVYKEGIRNNYLPSLCTLGLGKISYRRDKFEEAHKYVDQSIKLDPNNYQAYKWKAKILIDNGKYEKAIPLLNRAIKINPNRQSLYVNRGSCYSTIGKNKLALQDFNKAIQIEPSPKVFIRRAQLHSNMKQYKKAILDYTRGQKDDWNVDAIYIRKAFCYSKLGQLDKAVKEYDTLINRNPLDDEAKANRAKLYLKMNQPQKALMDLNYAIDNYPMGTPRHLYKLRAEAHKKLGMNKKAQEDLKKAESN